MSSEKRKPKSLDDQQKGNWKSYITTPARRLSDHMLSVIKRLGFKNPQKVSKQGLGFMWNGDGIHVHAPTSLYMNHGPSKGRYLKQEVDQEENKMENTLVAKRDSKEACLSFLGFEVGTIVLWRNRFLREFVIMGLHLKFLLPTYDK